ncbi:LysR substrate-binding domain-containing protein [Parapusillimonas granuli]|uniref:LysR family transcriptional regulator n=1 Tax=Parapusillimonas granuli TaxID=380911 RepID=A0A853G3Q6_9BURK|nr:DNA-binding transcriptional LysR family regulator [Parapusillimonas granuli]MEB2399282.1 LysR substrate-binding domain-containing protein [Alcaligenaceae bacterium]NYT50939.1 LysR family transcriptional regulator [Parapusillimonas granuli]
METDYLKTFSLVAELGSMAEASRRLGITPAAVAHHIRKIEKDLGIAVVTRAGRSVVPTVAGHQLLGKSRPLLSELANLRASLQRSDIEGELRLGVINSALHTFLPDILNQYGTEYPKVRARVHAGTSYQLFHQLQEGLVDAAICQHPPFALPKAFGWLPLREEPLVVLAHRSLADQPPLDLLRTERYLRYDRRLGGGRLADDYLRRHEIAPDESFELDSLLTIALMVDRRLGVSLVPNFGSPLIASLDIAAIALDDAPGARVFGVIWKRSTEREALVRALLSMARGMAGSVDPSSGIGGPHI